MRRKVERGEKES